MRVLASRPTRIFLIAWMVYSVHFATNVVREHYPAFALIERGTFWVDDYRGFHSDIFVHPNGHAVVGNQVLVSALAAVPLFVFSPVLDALQRYSLAKIAAEGVTEAEYRIDKPMRRDFFRLVKERGLDLRFGAATVVTSVFFMAPLTALFLVFFYRVLRLRGVDADQASGVSLLLGFGTPLFYRATVLGHNFFVMFAMFLAFFLLWVRPGLAFPVSTRNRFLAGFFGGVTLATDYVGVLILPLLYGYLVIPRAASASWKVSIRESLVMVVGSIPPILFLLYSQWSMYGNAFLPGQYWMPNQNAYVTVGARGFTLPDPDLFWQNLFHPGFGMYLVGAASGAGPDSCDLVSSRVSGSAEARAPVRSPSLSACSCCSARRTSIPVCSSTAASAIFCRWCRSCSWRSPTIGSGCRPGPKWCSPSQPSCTRGW